MKSHYINLIKLVVLTIFLINAFSYTKEIRRLTTDEKSNLSSSNFQIEGIIDKKKNIHYTQGLIFEPETQTLVESGGLYGESVLVRYKYPSLEPIKSVKLDKKYFGEGISKCGNSIYQLTWRERKVLKYNSETLNPEGELDMDENMREGWGLAKFDADTLVATDGSANLFFLDCNNKLKSKRIVLVEDKNAEVNYLNDLVVVDGYVYANKYYDTRIYKIDPTTGEVLKTYDLSGYPRYEVSKKTLTPERYSSGEVLNGITYDKERKLFIISGKKWGHVFEVKLN